MTGSRSSWRGVFIADLTQRNSVKVTLAESGVLVNEAARNRFVLHLEQGTTHEYDPSRPDEYSIASFTDTEIPILVDQGGTGRQSATRRPILILTQLWQHIHQPRDRQPALVELHYRFALPVAAIVLALVGIPLGISTRKGGKSLGVMLSLLLFFVYYILMAFGLSFAKQGRVSPIIGLWLANVLFAVAGIMMLSNLSHVRTRMMFLQDAFDDIVKRWQQWRARRSRSQQPSPAPGAGQSRRAVPANPGYLRHPRLDLLFCRAARRLYRRVHDLRFLPGFGRHRSQPDFRPRGGGLLPLSCFPRLFT